MTTDRPLRLVMMGMGPFALPTFESLHKTRHAVAALVTKPPPESPGRSPPPKSPLREIAREHGTPILEPVNVNEPAARTELARFEADLFVVCDYGRILAPETLALARLGGINLHGSLLPKYRGAAPVNWSIYHGETETGVTVIHMNPRIDAGDCLARSATPIGPDETAPELESRLAELGAPLVCDVIDRLAGGAVEAIPQDPAQATRAPRLKKTDGHIDWTRPAAAIRNQVRAFEPWPRSYTTWERPSGEPMRLILGPVEIAPGVGCPLPGTVVSAAGDQIVVAAGEGSVIVTSLQPAGKRMLTAREFLSGYLVQPGHRFS